MSSETNLAMKLMEIIHIYGEVHEQSGTYSYNQVEQVHDQSLTLVHPYYPFIGETIESSQEIYGYHVQYYTSNYMGHMTSFNYCILLDGRASYQPTRNSCLCEYLNAIWIYGYFYLM